MLSDITQKRLKAWLLDLATGETLALPPELDWDKNADAVWKWAHEHGIHVTGLNVASQQSRFRIHASFRMQTHDLFGDRQYIVQLPDEQVKATVLRGGQRVELILPMQ